jgi:hypothetical protein
MQAKQTAALPRRPASGTYHPCVPPRVLVQQADVCCSPDSQSRSRQSGPMIRLATWADELSTPIPSPPSPRVVISPGASYRTRVGLTTQDARCAFVDTAALDHVAASCCLLDMRSCSGDSMCWIFHSPDYFSGSVFRFEFIRISACVWV